MFSFGGWISTYSLIFIHFWVFICFCNFDRIWSKKNKTPPPNRKQGSFVRGICLLWHQRCTANTHQAALMCRCVFRKVRGSPLHSNMLIYLCSALIGPSDARPAPPAFAEASSRFCSRGPCQSVRACSSNVMQTNTLVVWHFEFLALPRWKKGRR